jgi:MFS family permease
MDRAQQRVFVALSVTTAVTLITEGVVNVNLMRYAAGLQVPATGLGLVFAAHRFARLLVAPWAGLAADRVGRRPLLLLGFACVSAALAALVGEAAAPESRAAVMAASSTLSDLANSAGAILGASVALRVGYGVTYLGTAAAVGIGGSLLLSPRHSRGRALDEAKTGAPA